MDATRIILACIKNADINFNLINNGDRIAIGVSGGKDSMALLYTLSLYRKFSKINFDVIPIIIDLGFDNFNAEPIKEYVSLLGFNLEIVDGKSVYEILKIQKDKQHMEKLPCSICSRMKKAIINKAAHKFNCNKVTFAHHKTDAIETLFLNEIYGGRIATFSPKMFLSNEQITFIRPLIYVDESDIKRLIKEENIPVFPSNCPNDGKTKRADIKEILLSLNKAYPESKDNFLTMLENRSKEDVFYMHNEHKVDGFDIYYKEIFDIQNFIKENKFIKTNPKINSISHHIHVYRKSELIGIILLNGKDKTYTISHLYIKNSKYLMPLLLDLYKQMYSKVNPLTLLISSKTYKPILKEMYFEKYNSTHYILSINPIKLENILRKEGKLKVPHIK